MYYANFLGIFIVKIGQEKYLHSRQRGAMIHYFVIVYKCFELHEI